MVEWACQIYAHCGKMDEKKLTRGNSISQDNQTLHTTVTSERVGLWQLTRLFIIPMLSASFLPYKGMRMHKICECITLKVQLSWFDHFFFLLMEDKAKPKCSGMTNLSIGVLVDNAHRHFTHSSHFSYGARKNATQLIKYLWVLSTKTSNNVC